MGASDDFVREFSSFLLSMQDNFGTGAVVRRNESRVFAALRKFGIIGDKPGRRVLAAEARKLRGSDGIVLEFGVYKASSANFLARLLPRSTIYAFDSFSGFPGDGRPDWGQDFSLVDLPKVRKNVQLQVGYFAEALPKFIREHRDNLADKVILIHVDCDIYSSTATVLRELGKYLAPGLVIVFDEIINYPEFAFNEALALFEFLQGSGLDARWSTNIGRMWLPGGVRAGTDFGGWKDFRRSGFFQNQSLVLCHRGEGGLIDKSIGLDPAAELVDHVAAGLEERGLPLG